MSRPRLLTARGRGFVSAGVTALACSVVFGLADLARIAVLLLALPAVSLWVVRRGRHRLGLARTVSPGQVAPGQSAEVRLELSNEGRTPTGMLLLEEQVPYALGVRPRFVVEGLGFSGLRRGTPWHDAVDYSIRSDVRGRFVLGPMTVRVDDPFGLVELTRTFTTTSAVVVTPRMVGLPMIPLSGTWTGSGDNRPRDFAGGSAEDVTVREYRHGDELRRVHWRASAHAGELMVRREEQPWQSRATVLLDNRSRSHRGRGAGSSFEYAVSAAASIAVHLVQRGFRVRLVTTAGHQGDHTWHEHAASDADTGRLLETLAVLETTPRPAVDGSWLRDASPGLLVALLGSLVDEDPRTLQRMRHAAGTGLAVALDVEQWSAASPGVALSGQAAQLLTGQGWRAVTAGPADPLAVVWQQLGRARRTPVAGAVS